MDDSEARTPTFSRRAAMGGLVGAAVVPVFLKAPPARAATRRVALVTVEPVPRSGHTATALPSGLVLVAGGFNQGALSDVQLYDPGRGFWFAAAPMNTARSSHAAALLPGGKVLVTGGGGEDAGGALSDAEIYDPDLDQWLPAAPMLVARYGHAASAAGEGVVVVGGFNRGPISTAEFFDGGTWSQL